MQVVRIHILDWVPFSDIKQFLNFVQSRHRDGVFPQEGFS